MTTSSVEKYEERIKKAQEQLAKLKKAKELEENKQLIKLGKLYIEIQQTLDDTLTTEKILENLESELTEVKGTQKKSEETENPVDLEEGQQQSSE